VKFCTQCGAETVPGAQFCSGCGAALGGEEVTPTVLAGSAPVQAVAPAPLMAGYPAAGYAPPMQGAGGYPQPGWGPTGYGPRAGGGSAVTVFGCITVALLAAHLYFLRYAGRQYDILQGNCYDCYLGLASVSRYGRHNELDIASFFAYETLFVAAMVLAIIATVRSRRGARGWWVATLVTSLVANFLEMFGGLHDFYFGQIWYMFRSQFGLQSYGDWERWIALPGLIALVLTVVMIIASRSRRPAPYGPGGFAPPGTPMGYHPHRVNYPQPGPYS
jgi:hypothetical protein